MTSNEEESSLAKVSSFFSFSYLSEKNQLNPLLINELVSYLLVS